MGDRMIRRWSARVFAVYVPDGVFGRRVGLADSREEAEILAAQALRASACLESNAGTIVGCAQRERANAPLDDLNPILFSPGSEAPA